MIATLKQGDSCTCADSVDPGSITQAADCGQDWVVYRTWGVGSHSVTGVVLELDVTNADGLPLDDLLQPLEVREGGTEGRETDRGRIV